MDIIVSYTLLHYRIMIQHHQPQPHKEWTYHTELISLVQLKKIFQNFLNFLELVLKLS